MLLRSRYSAHAVQALLPLQLDGPAVLPTPRHVLVHYSDLTRL